MKYLHTMVRVTDLDASLAFYCDKLGLAEISRTENQAGRFTLVFLGAPGDEDAVKAGRAPTVELTFNWDPTRAAATSATWPTPPTISTRSASG
jgi:lactoylglutathione lyase